MRGSEDRKCCRVALASGKGSEPVTLELLLKTRPKLERHSATHASVLVEDNYEGMEVVKVVVLAFSI